MRYPPLSHSLHQIMLQKQFPVCFSIISFNGIQKIIEIDQLLYSNNSFPKCLCDHHFLMLSSKATQACSTITIGMTVLSGIQDEEKKLRMIRDNQLFYGNTIAPYAHKTLFRSISQSILPIRSVKGTITQSIKQLPISIII